MSALSFFIVIFLSGLCVGACGSSSAASRRRSIRDGDSGSINRLAAEASIGSRQQGLASYYSNKLAGRRTASGDIYRPQLLTAAHRKLPFGTQVRVTRLDYSGESSGASVVVLINDRGPFGANRILDLSYAAARALGMLRAGVVRVEVLVLGKP